MDVGLRQLRPSSELPRGSYQLDDALHVRNVATLNPKESRLPFRVAMTESITRPALWL